MNERYLVVKGIAGMANRVLTLLNAIIYAQVTNRKLFVDWGDGVYSNNKINIFSSLFDCSLIEKEIKLNKNNTVLPTVWKDNLEKDVVTFFNNNTLWRKYSAKEIKKKYSIDISNVEFKEDMLVFVDYNFAFEKIQKYINKLPEFWPKDPKELQKFLLKKYIKPSIDISRKIEKFKIKNFTENIIGVHVRYTDNMKKVHRRDMGTDIDSYFPVIDELLREKPQSKIFLSTDNKKVIELFKEKYKDIIFTDKFFPDDGVAIHSVKNFDKTKIAEEAIIDLYLLSLSNQLVYSSGSSYGELASLLSDTELCNIFDLSPQNKKILIKETILSQKYIREKKSIYDFIGRIGHFLYKKLPKIYRLLKPYFPDGD
jgi:hypothetical protein